MTVWGVDCIGWGRRHVEQYPSREAAEARLEHLGGRGKPFLVRNDGTGWTKATDDR